MPKPNDWTDGKRYRLGWNSVFLFGFGLAVLVFLVAIERPNWFHIRPMSGTAVAMSYTAQPPAQAPAPIPAPSAAR